MMERRDFLKRMGSLCLGIFFLPLIRFFREKRETPRHASMREARHYTSGDHLAG